MNIVWYIHHPPTTKTMDSPGHTTITIQQSLGSTTIVELWYDPTQRIKAFEVKSYQFGQGLWGPTQISGLRGFCWRWWDEDLSLGQFGQERRGYSDHATTIHTSDRGVAIVCVNAKHKLRQVHYIQEIVEEAASASSAHQISNKWNPNQNGHASW